MSTSFPCVGHRMEFLEQHTARFFHLYDSFLGSVKSLWCLTAGFSGKNRRGLLSSFLLLYSMVSSRSSWAWEQCTGSTRSSIAWEPGQHSVCASRYSSTGTFWVLVPLITSYVHCACQHSILSMGRLACYNLLCVYVTLWGYGGGNYSILLGVHMTCACSHTSPLSVTSSSSSTSLPYIMITQLSLLLICYSVLYTTLHILQCTS